MPGRRHRARAGVAWQATAGDIRCKFALVRPLLLLPAMFDNRWRMQGGEIVAHRFVIEERAGAGGMGTVYRAHDRVSGARVAVKLVTDDAQQGSARFVQEARVLCELEHGAIVRYISHGVSDDGRAYLVMEWLEGEDLSTRLARGPLAIEEALDLARRVAEALAVAHARGIVHRDIKPANVFLAPGHASPVKVLDFGIARTKLAGGFDTTMVPITRTGVVIGTVGYMSPEQARGATDVDARTDVFALGCVLFECLTGRAAFSGANAVAVLAKVLLEDAPRVRQLRRDVPTELDELVAKMLAKDPAQRPRDTAAVLRALASISASGSRGTPNASSGGLADREQRLVSIVLARGVSGKRARVVLEDADPIELLDGALLFALRGTDPVTHAAAAAIALRGLEPEAAIAIATGRVETSNDAVVGPIIDRAATMMARAGETALDELSAALLVERYEIAGERRLMGAARRTTEPRTLLGKRTPCVGRDKELALLAATFEESASEPVARAVLVTGVAGSGKSRLQHELVGRVGQDATTLFARGDPMGAGSSLSMVRQLVRSAAGVREGDAIATQHEALRGHLSKLFSGDVLDRASEMLGELIGAPSAQPSPALRAAHDDARILAPWLRHAFEEWLAAMGEAGPVLVVLEDLHWGDRTSVAYLDEALRSNAARPLMVVALARPEVHDLFPELWARASCQELRLSALTKRAAEKLVKSVLEGASDSVVDHVVERAEGNAFYLEELIRHIAEGTPGSLPDTVLALAEARIARLDPERRRVLRAASVFGEVFWADGVSTLLDGSETTDATLRALVADELLVARPASKFPSANEFAFRHGLLRDVAYAILTDEDRAAAHRRAGEWLDRVGEKDFRVIADHFERSDDPRRAAVWLVRASKRVFDNFDLTAMHRMLERGIELGLEGEGLGEAQLLLSMINLSRGEWAEALTHGKDAYALVPRASPDSYVAAATVLQSGAYVGDFEAAPLIVGDLLNRVPAEPSGPYGLALNIVVDILDSIGQGESGMLLQERARALAEATLDPDPVFLGWLSYSRAAAKLKRDDLWGGIETLAPAAGYFEAGGVPMGTAFVNLAKGIVAIELGQGGVARGFLREAATFFSAGGASMWDAWCALHEAWSYVDEARFDDAIATATSVFHTNDHRHARAIVAAAHLEQGELERAEHHVGRALDGIDDFLVTPWVVSIVHLTDARVHLARGRTAQAVESVSRAVNAATLMAPSVRSMLEQTRVEVLLATGAVGPARDLLSAASARVERHRRSLPKGDAETYARASWNARILALAAEHLGHDP